jgi:ParB family chromosome partitioning protein
MKTVRDISIQSSDYRDLPVAQLVESSTNPRKRYDEASLDELAESIRSQGVLAPLLVREVGPERFEIVAGSRRFRAAQRAGVASVPVRIVSLSDAEAIIAQVVENLQRENVHPLEEAHGFRALLDLPDQQYTVAMIAAKAGKNPQYVAARLKLTELIAPVADAFLADRLTLGHALLIAKLPAAQQGEVLKAAFKPSWGMNGQTDVLIPVKELAGWIESNLFLDLQSAPFDRTDTALVAEIGACHDCAKRTGANSLLFPESNCDQCLDRDCYKGKLAAHIASALRREPKLIQISTNWGTHNNGVLGRGQYVEIMTKASGNGHDKNSPERKKCIRMAKAIVVDGNHSGYFTDVCADLACEIHHAESRSAREAQERMRAEQGKQDERRKEELGVRKRMLAAILERISAPLVKADLELIAREFANRLPQEHRTLLSQRHSPTAINKKQSKQGIEIDGTLKNLDELGFSRLLIEMSLLDAAYNVYSRDDGQQVESIAKRHRVNVEKIRSTFAAEFAAKRKMKGQRSKTKPGRA